MLYSVPKFKNISFLFLILLTGSYEGGNFNPLPGNSLLVIKMILNQLMKNEKFKIELFH